MFLLKIFLFALLACVTLIEEAFCQNSTRIKPRLIVLTDISSLSLKEGEPDDGQSMVRLMLYSNDIDLEGLIATSNLRHGQRTRPELIRKVIDAYGDVYPNLVLHDKNYPAPGQLSALVRQGQPIALPAISFHESIGDGKDTEGSEWIIKVADQDDSRPVWISIWGGSADLAQALWKVRATRTAEELEKFISKLRVHMIYDQDSTGPWIRKEFPNLYCIFRHHGIRGMYRGGDTTLVRSRWVETNIRNDHGALGSLYVNYHGGDIWSGKMGRVKGIKEGDTPSFLYLMNNGLNVPEHPEWGNWSGRFRNDNGLWVEDVDRFASYETDPDPRMATVYRWRPAWQADFQARLDWCVMPFDGANHAPLLSTAKNSLKTTKAGKLVKLEAPVVADPDKDKVSYHWYFYPEEGNYTGVLPRLAANGKAASFVAPDVASAARLHVILEVTDDGTPALTSYQRFVVNVQP